MPELPEVETVVRGLARRITGFRIASVRLSRKDILFGHNLPINKVLSRRRIQRVNRQGKQIHFILGSDLSLIVHLGMTGRLFVADRDDPKDPHTHLRIQFVRRQTELRFCDPRRFGGLWLIDGAAHQKRKWIGRKLPALGPDALDISLRNFRKLLRRNRQIKGLLLDQQLIAGVGNIYCDESLHRVGIHPLTRACDLDDSTVRRLHQKLRQVLAEAIRDRGSSVSDYRTADKNRGKFQRRHRVYKRAGQPCKRCHNLIERILVSGRGTHICPKCQPLFAITSEQG
ncbi:MAG: bifunctional DNA-formamidopyrimidine glycosylase/DNA-(apurinic or apyrimidinic site) lyase [Planctomycetota bacterium]|nr:MAG: bifunctional DNA-formamidopyrimidine glycosylase/DNA-(apurinic or apyrimidinic site) lyase [Planctomycetota bacterium]